MSAQKRQKVAPTETKDSFAFHDLLDVLSEVYDETKEKKPFKFTHDVDLMVRKMLPHRGEVKTPTVAPLTRQLLGDDWSARLLIPFLGDNVGSILVDDLYAEDVCPGMSSYTTSWLKRLIAIRGCCEASKHLNRFLIYTLPIVTFYFFLYFPLSPLSPLFYIYDDYPHTQSLDQFWDTWMKRKFNSLDRLLWNEMGPSKLLVNVKNAYGGLSIVPWVNGKNRDQYLMFLDIFDRIFSDIKIENKDGGDAFCSAVWDVMTDVSHGQGSDERMWKHEFMNYGQNWWGYTKRWDSILISRSSTPRYNLITYISKWYAHGKMNDIHRVFHGFI